MNEEKTNQDSDADSEEDDWSRCPCCGKKMKNMLLHLKKSVVCCAHVNEEDHKKIIEQSKLRRKMKKKQWESERKMKDSYKVKAGQRVRTFKSRSLAVQKEYKLDQERQLPSQSVKSNESMEEENRRCPVCKKKCKNVLLHVKKRRLCNDRIKQDNLEKLLKESDEQRMKRQERAVGKRKKLQEGRKNQKFDHGNEKDSGDDEDEVQVKIPERCPNCNIKKKNILLHIQCTDMCYKMIDKQDFQEWRKMAQKESKRKYQLKFNERGGHNKARSIRREEEYERKEFEATRRFHKERVNWKRSLFIHLSGEILMYLSIGKVPDLAFRSVRDQLIQSDYSTYKDGIYTYKSLLNEEEEHAWVKEIKGQFLEAVIAFQIVILIPRSNWENAVKTVKEAGKEELGNKLFKLIGNLQASNTGNQTMWDGKEHARMGFEVAIPEKFRSICNQSESTRWEGNYNCQHREIFCQEDENLLIKYIENILGEQMQLIDEEVQELLKIKEDMENLYVAMAFAAPVSKLKSILELNIPNAKKGRKHVVIRCQCK